MRYPLLHFHALSPRERVPWCGGSAILSGSRSTSQTARTEGYSIDLAAPLRREFIFFFLYFSTTSNENHAEEDLNFKMLADRMTNTLIIDKFNINYEIHITFNSRQFTLYLVSHASPLGIFPICFSSAC